MISRTATTALLFCALLVSASSPALAQEGGEENTKRAQTGMKFLSASLSPRVAGMGGTGTTLQLQSTSLFYNPAGMAQMDNFGHAAVGTMQWIADINYNNASVSIRPADGAYGVIGFTFMQVDYGELEGTRRANNDQGYTSTGTFSPGSWAVGVGYAYPVTNRISVGAKVKYAKQDLGASVMSTDGTTKSNELGTGAYDFGIQYDTDYRGIEVAMSVRNFSPEVQYEQQSFELPMELSVGISTDIFEATDFLADPNDQHSFTVMVRGVTPRDFSERMHFGGEYTFMDVFSLRSGYTLPSTNVEEGVNFGAGLQTDISGFELGADYSYTTYDVFDGVNRLGINVGF
jgi:hypothetical protein